MNTINFCDDKPEAPKSLAVVKPFPEDIILFHRVANADDYADDNGSFANGWKALKLFFKLNSRKEDKEIYFSKLFVATMTHSLKTIRATLKETL